MDDYDPQEDARRSYDAALAAKKARGDTAGWSPIRREVVIGDCRLILGDCLQVLPLLGKVDHVITDPPYEKEAHRKDRRVMRRDGLVAGPLSFDQLTELSRETIANETARVSAGWLIFFCQAEGIAPWRDAIEAAGAKYKAPMVWIKPDGMPQFNGQGPGMGHESLVTAWAGKGHSKWNGGGRHGVFVIPKGESVRAVHETQKPVRLMRELVHLFTDYGQTVLDPFMGSGTTGVAALRLGRKFVGIEMDEKYFELACRRIRNAYAQPDFLIEPERPPEPKQQVLL